MQSRVVTLLITVATLLSQSDGRLNNAPQDTESKVGDTTYFNCSTNFTSKEIFWNHGDQYVYSENGILPPYDERFEIDRNASIGSYNLVIRSVEPGDAGEYICIDDDGHGTRGSAQLIVLENDPDCQSNIQPDGVIGQNVFNIAPDEVQLTCTVNYHGKIFPQMEWKNVEDNDSTNSSNVTSHVRSDNRITYTLNLKGDMSLDNSSYVCQTKRSAHDQYKCYSKTIKILYFVSRNMTERSAFRGDEITCTADSNTFNCSSQWYHDNYNTCPLSCEKTIKTHLLGEYLCMVKCYIRGTDYPPFKVLKAVVIEASTSPPPSIKGKLTAAFVTSTVIIIIIVVLIAVGVNRRNERRNFAKFEAEFTRLLQVGQRVMHRQEANSKKKNKQEETIEYAEIEIELRHKISREGTTKEKTILGVAILGENMFLVHKENPDVEVYDCKNVNVDCRPHVLHVQNVVSPLDICSSKENDCLYIMDTKDLDFDEKVKFDAREVFKINTNGDILKKWSTKNDACGFLSASKGGNVIITVQDGHMLLEYTSEGNLVRSIDLPACIRPWHAIKRGDDDYIVTHGTYDHLHRVCLVDRAGYVNNSFGDEMGSAANQLHIPYYLAVGSSGCVLVADLCNNRVLLLDKDLKFTANIVPKYNQRFQSPRRIYLDEDLHVLIVVIGAGIPQEIINVETSDLKDDKGPVNSDYPMISMQKTEQVTTPQKNDDSVEIISAQAKDHLEEKGKTDKLLEPDDSPRARMTENGVLKRIEEDFRLLVFDIQPLMDNYFRSSTYVESRL